MDKGLADLVPGCANMLPDKLLTDCKGDAWLAAVAKQYPDLTEIDIAECGAVTDRGLAQLASICAKLLPDQIPSVAKGDRFLTVVAKMHPSLTELNLRDCTAVTDGFVLVRNGGIYVCMAMWVDTSVGSIFNALLSRMHSTRGLRFLAHGCKQLTALDLTNCKNVTDVGLSKLAEHCLKLLPDKLLSLAKGDTYCIAIASKHSDLTEINLAGCESVTDYGLELLVRGCKKLLPDQILSTAKGDQFCAAVAELHARLTSINLIGCNSVTDTGLAFLAKACPNLHPDKVLSLGKGERFCEIMAKRHTDLTALDLRNCFSVTDAGLSVAVQYCPKLKPDKIKSFAKGDRFCAVVAKVHRELTEINLQGCEQVTDSGLALLSEGCRNLLPHNLRSFAKGDKYCSVVAKQHDKLEHIDLSNCAAVTDRSMTLIATCCSQLGYCDLTDCPNVTDEGLSVLIELCPKLLPESLISSAKGDKFCAALAKQHPELTQLDLRRFEAITDEGLALLIEGCPRLQPYSIDSAAKGDKFCGAVAKQHSELLAIDLLGCENVTDEGLKLLGEGCPKLLPDKIHSFAKGDRFLEAVAKRHPQLESISLRDCSRVTEQGIVTLAEGCIRLHHVDLSGCSDKITAKQLEPLIERCPRLLPDELIFANKDDTFCTAIAKQHPKLTSINLEGATKVTSTGVCALADSCVHLTSVNLLGCEGVSDGSLAQLIGACPKLLPDAVESKYKQGSFVSAVGKMHPDLTSIDLSKVEMSKDVLKELATACPNLTSIDLTGCAVTGLASLIENCPNLLPDNVIGTVTKDTDFCTAVAKNHPRLKSLNLAKCKVGISDEAIASLAEGCANLESLDLSGCAVTDEALATLMEHTKHLLPDHIKSVEKGDKFCAAVAASRPDLESIDLSGAQSKVTGIGVTSLTACKNLSGINLKGCRGVTDASLATLVRACPKLTDSTIVSEKKGDRYCAAIALRSKGMTAIDLSKCFAVTDAGLEVLVSNCPKLMPDDIKSGAKADRFCAAVAKQHPNLTSIDLKAMRVTGRGVTALLEGCKDLESIDLTDAQQVSDRDLAAIIVDFPRLDPNKIKSNSKALQFCIAISKVHPALATINLNKARNVTNMACDALSKTCTNLTALDLLETRATDEGLAQLIKCCPKLLPDKIQSTAKSDMFCAALAKRGAAVTSVDLNGCRSLTRKGLISLAENCPGIISLMLNPVTTSTQTPYTQLTSAIIDRSLAAFLRGCPNLTPDNIVSDCKGDSFCAAVAKHRPDVTSLALTSSPVTDAGLASLIEGCSKLVALDLTECEAITDNALAQLLYAFPKLQPNKLVSTTKGDQYCAALGKVHPELTAIDLADCLVTDTGLATLGTHFPGLQALDLAENSSVTDNALAKLMAACPKLPPSELKSNRKGDKYCRALRLSHSHLSSIDLSECALLTDIGLSALSTSCPNLVAVNVLSCRQVTDAGLARLVRRLPILELEKLQAHGKGDAFCDAVAAMHAELTELDLSESAVLTVKGVMTLMKSCSQLRKLLLVGCKNIDDAALAMLIKEFPRLDPNTIVSWNKSDLFCAAVAAERPNLTAIDLSGGEVTLDGVLKLASGCSRLKNLDISLCSEIKPRVNMSLDQLGQTCPYLSSINFAGCKDAVTDESMVRIAKTCRLLTNVCVSSCIKLSSESTIKFVSNCKKLKSLDLSECVDAVTDTVIGAIGKHPKLLKLDVARCTRLTKACTALMPPQLKHLNLARCENIAQVGSLGSRCAELIGLNVAGCKLIGNGTIIELSQKCRSLEELVLAGCVNVTDEGVAALTNCSKLAKVNLAGCVNVTDSSIAAIARANKKLKELNIAFCFKLTDAAIAAVQQHCRMLNILDLTFCSQLTDEAVSALAAANTDLNAVDLLLWTKNLSAKHFRKLIESNKVVGFSKENIRFPDNFVGNEGRTRFQGKTPNWCPFVYPIPFPKSGVHTATVRFFQCQSAMVGVTNHSDPMKVRNFAGSGNQKDGISIYSNVGEIYYGGRSHRGPTKSYKPKVPIEEPAYVSVIYNATTKQLSWKSNETEWLNSHVFENAEDVHFTVSVTGTYTPTDFEVVMTDWVSGAANGKLSRSLTNVIPYIDMEPLLERVP